MKGNILVIGAYSQLGASLTEALRCRYGSAHIVATDFYPPAHVSDDEDSCLYLDALNKRSLAAVIAKYQITQIYLLAEMLSATGECSPQEAWKLNVQGLLNVLEAAKEHLISKVFWPSSIAVFGHHAPRKPCPQHTVLQPATVYGISKSAGEDWCQYYFNKYGVDVRSVRLPGLISYTSASRGAATAYASAIFHQALQKNAYTCYLKPAATLPMMYMPDAVRAIIELMESPVEMITVRTSYNISGMSFTPGQLAAQIKKHLPAFKISYQPDYRQSIADTWPTSIDDRIARRDWNWAAEYDIAAMTENMLSHLRHCITDQGHKIALSDQ